MIEQFYGTLLLDDEISVNDDNPQSLMVGGGCTMLQMLS